MSRTVIEQLVTCDNGARKAPGGSKSDKSIDTAQKT